MNNLGIVIAREYLTRIKKPSFIILTLLMPFLMVGIVCVPILFNAVKDDSKKEVVIVDKTGKYLPLFIEAQKIDSLQSESYTFAPADKPLEAYKQEDSMVEAVISIADDPAKNPDGCKIYSRGEVQRNLQSYVEDIISTQIHKDKLASYNVPQLENIIKDIETGYSVKTIKWTEEGGETISSGLIATTLGMLTAFLIYMFVLVYGAMVMQGVMEEKTNRIVEVIVGSVKPFNLMMGKILGVMFVGFTQIGIWITMIAILGVGVSVVLGSSMDADTMQQISVAGTSAQQQAALNAMNNSPMAEFTTILGNLPLGEILLLFVLYFLGGYILYSSFFAAVGASVNSQEDTSQFMMPMIIIMIIAMYGAMGSMENTNGPLAFWASLFPLTSPIVMMVRIPLGVPLWQEALSVVILYATAFGFVWVAGRIYRIGILMYGKKPTVKEIIKWMRYK